MDTSKLKFKIRHKPVDRIPMDARLKRLLLRYATSAFLAIALISGALISQSYITSLADTLNKFQTVKINSVKMKEATRKEGETVASARSIFRSYDKSEAMESIILTAVDSIKSRMKNVDIMVENFEK